MVRGKEKAARVSLEYFRRVGGGRRYLGLMALAIGCAGLAVTVVLGWWTRAASPGPMHEVHSAWEHDCRQCHEPFRPTSSQNALGAAGVLKRPSDQLCQQCHAGPPHHASREIEGDSGHCASCHFDHRGRNSPLSRPPDHTCTRCHQNLAAHVKDGKPLYAGDISAFANHPPFQVGEPGHRVALDKATDPGRLKFNHQLHVTPGQKASATQQRAWRYQDIQDPALRERYRKEEEKRSGKAVAETEPVVLDCRSCHQLDSSDAPPPAPGQNLPPRGAGDYVPPVTFDQHCKACHPLTVNTGNQRIEIPHHLQPPEAQRFLKGYFLDTEIRALKQAVEKGTPLPGENKPLDQLKKEREARIEKELKTIESILYRQIRLAQDKVEQPVFETNAGCKLCHPFEPAGKPPEEARVPPTRQTSVWLPHAHFSHRAHRTMECKDCHTRATSATTSDEVMLPNVDNCKECHAPLRTVDGQSKGGVRADCVSCHRYHHGDSPLAGRGALERGPMKGK